MLRNKSLLIIKSIPETSPKPAHHQCKKKSILSVSGLPHFLSVFSPDAPRPPSLASLQPLPGHGRGEGSLAPGGWLCKLPLSSHSPFPSVGPQFPRRADGALYHPHAHGRGDSRRDSIVPAPLRSPSRASPQVVDALCLVRTGERLGGRGLVAVVV